MNKKMIGFSALLILVIFGLVVVQLFKTTISPQNIIISEAVVSEGSIELSGDFTASAVGYESYSIENTDEKLFIKIKGSTLSLTKPQGSFDIMIENTFGKIDEVYLQGTSPSDTRLIWQKK